MAVGVTIAQVTDGCILIHIYFYSVQVRSVDRLFKLLDLLLDSNHCVITVFFLFMRRVKLDVWLFKWYVLGHSMALRYVDLSVKPTTEYKYSLNIVWTKPKVVTFGLKLTKKLGVAMLK